jgi:hypothetical protein
MILKDNQIVSVSVYVSFFKDKQHGYVVARCPDLRITTEDCDAREILKNLNWHIVSEAISITKR